MEFRQSTQIPEKDLNPADYHKNTLNLLKERLAKNLPKQKTSLWIEIDEYKDAQFKAKNSAASVMKKDLLNSTA